MQFDYSLIDEQLAITDPKGFHYNCDEHPVDGDKLIIDMPTDEIKADWLSACADVAYLLIWPTIMRFIWQIDKDE
ncbi:hypothetical protein [Bifidobacterium dentium]|uniref:hypothetical protein n=1 Tax=Bifidobacterium dentium TaxID=1689 RepID=UPI003D16D9FF